MMSLLREIGRQPEREPAGEAAEHQAVSTEPDPQQTAQPMAPEPEPIPSVRLYQSRAARLQGAADSASAHVRTVYLTFLLFGLYLAIIFGATTHEQLLRAGPITLPLLDVELPLRGFYWVAPALFVLLHLNLLLQLYLLSGKLHRLDSAIGSPAGRQPETEAQQDRRAQLYPFPFSHMLIGGHHGWLMRFLLWLFVWLTVLVLPVVLLLAGQVRFLPYHDAATTMWHRALIAVDVLLILIFWRPVRHPEDRLVPYPRRWLWHQGKALPGTLAALAFSFVVFTFPGGEGSDFGDPMEELFLAIAPESLIDRGQTPPMLRPTRYVFDWPFLDRNLVVREANLVDSWPTQAQIDHYGEILAWQNFGAPPILRGRDLRYADLSQSILVRGDFRGANLQGSGLTRANLENAVLSCDDRANCAILQEAVLAGANLRGAVLAGANLQAAQLAGANLQGSVLAGANLQGAVATSANLEGVDLQRANLRDAVLTGTKLHSAILQDADIQGANLAVANLQGASLARAYLQRAILQDANLQSSDLGGARLQGAKLDKAKLEGANLQLARVQGAVLIGANLQGAHLRHAKLQRANLLHANLSGADLQHVHLQGANLMRVNFTGADLRGGRLWQARLDHDAARYRLADLRNLDLNPPGADELDRWTAEAEEIEHEEARGLILRHLDVLRQLAREGTRWEPRFPDNLAQHEDVLFDPAPPPSFIDFDPRLAEFLLELACESHGPPSGVTQNSARRAIGERERGRLYPALLADAMTGDHCPPAAGLPESMHDSLRRLAGR